MNTIEFNRKYTKLPTGIKTAVLVACEGVRLQDLTLAFILYDTEYRDGDMIAYNELRDAYLRGEDGNYLCLILKSDTGAIFTTLRKDNEENREKYMNVPTGWRVKHRQQFNIIIKED